jgi:hypothetical protein
LGANSLEVVLAQQFSDLDQSAQPATVLFCLACVLRLLAYVILIKVVFVDVPLETIFRFAPFSAGFCSCGLSSFITFITLVLSSQICVAPLGLLSAFEEYHFSAALTLLLGLEEGRIVDNLVLIFHRVNSSLFQPIKVLIKISTANKRITLLWDV